MVTRERKLEALQRTFLYSVIGCVDKAPGGVISRMRKEDREVLKELTSEDLASMRFDPYCIDKPRDYSKYK